MRVLVTFGSKRGGTEGIARALSFDLVDEGIEACVLRPAQVHSLEGFDAVIVGGALYMNRWHRDARRFVERHVHELRQRPVWFFSSGPIDDSADRGTIPPTPQVAALMERVGALGHATFGGRLARDAKGFLASRLARNNSGDFRNADSIRGWAKGLALVLPQARPGASVPQPARSLSHLAAHGLAGWAICTAAMAVLLHLGSRGAAITAHTVIVPVVFATVASRYFRGRGSRAPLPTALAFATLKAVLDLGIAAGLGQGPTSFAGFWLPLLLIVAATWATGVIVSAMPAPKVPPHAPLASSP